MSEHLPGEQFGKYLLVGEMAVGGMAELFLAVHTGLEGFVKVVALKRILPHLTKSQEFLRMFLDEARLAARLDHPNIVRIYELGEHAGSYFMAMEYLPGEDLARVLKRCRRLAQAIPVDVAIALAAEVCEGLHSAHELTDTMGRALHLVHRDINPSNIILTYHGAVKIVDFGVAKASNNTSKTVAGMIKGKLAYMPPEQIVGGDVDRRADVFAIGAVLWECLVGQPLFGRESEPATINAVMTHVVQPPSELRPDVPPELDQIVMRALARDPLHRYVTSEEMHGDLAALLASRSRTSGRQLAKWLEAIFGTPRAEAKRAIAQGRTLSQNISAVMRLHITDVQALNDLHASLRAEVTPSGVSAPPVPGSGSGPGQSQPPQHPSMSGSSGISGVSNTGWTPPPMTPTGVHQQPSVIMAKRSKLGMIFAIVASVAVIGLGAFLLKLNNDPQSGALIDPPTGTPARKGTVKLDTKPSGAGVFLGGEPTFKTTPIVLDGLEPGSITVKLELDGHAAASETIPVKAGETTDRIVQLQPLSARLVVMGLPEDGTLKVDGEEIIPGELPVLTVGKHLLVLEVGGREVARDMIELSSGDNNFLHRGGVFEKK